MNRNNTQYSEDRMIIDIKELLWRVAEQWKAFLIFIVAFSLIFMTVSYVRTNAHAEAEGEPVILTPAEQLEALDSDSQSKVLSSIRTNEAVSEISGYIASAPLMQIDPGNAKGVVQLWNVSADESIRDSVMDAYRSDTFTYAVADSLADTLAGSYSSDGLAELIVIDNESEKNSSNIISMVIYLTDDMNETEAEKAATAGVQKASEEVSAGAGSHEISLISSEIKPVSGNYIALRQTDIYSGLNDLYAQKKSAYDNLNSRETAVYKNILSDTSVTVGGASKVPFFSMRKAALSIILALVLYLMVLTLKTILSGRVQSPYVAEDLFGIRKLGDCYPESKKSFFDSLFKDYEVISHRYKNHTDIDKSAGEIAETLKALAKRDNCKDILLVTSAGAKETFGSFKEALRSCLDGCDINISEAVVDAGNGINLSEALLMEHDSAVMIIDKKKSSLKDVKDVSNKCRYCNVPLFGGIYVG